MAVYSYLMVWAATLLGIRIGYFEPDTPHWLLFGATLAANLVFFLIIRSGRSESWTDPSLTVPQMMVGIILISVWETFIGMWMNTMAQIIIMTPIYVGIITIGTIALIMDSCLRIVSRKFLAWQERIGG